MLCPDCAATQVTAIFLPGLVGWTWVLHKALKQMSFLPLSDFLEPSGKLSSNLKQKARILCLAQVKLKLYKKGKVTSLTGQQY